VQFTFTELAAADRTEIKLKAQATRESKKANRQEIRLLEQKLARAKARPT
jgi:hypothetical protein